MRNSDSNPHGSYSGSDAVSATVAGSSVGAGSRVADLSIKGQAHPQSAELPHGYDRAIRATAVAWKRIEDEFGFLTSSEVTAIKDVIPSFSLAEDKYPRFLRDTEGTPNPVILDTRAESEGAGWSDASMILWLCSPSGSFGGGRPVDHLADADFVKIASRVFNTDW